MADSPDLGFLQNGSRSFQAREADRLNQIAILKRLVLCCQHSHSRLPVQQKNLAGTRKNDLSSHLSPLERAGPRVKPKQVRRSAGGQRKRILWSQLLHLHC